MARPLRPYRQRVEQRHQHAADGELLAAPEESDGPDRRKHVEDPVHAARTAQHVPSLPHPRHSPRQIQQWKRSQKGAERVEQLRPGQHNDPGDGGRRARGGEHCADPVTGGRRRAAAGANHRLLLLLGRRRRQVGGLLVHGGRLQHVG